MSVTEETSVYSNGIDVDIDSNINQFDLNGDQSVDSFLFTSESVGEGHPGIHHFISILLLIYFYFIINSFLFYP
jgi:hypothetical protein